jgi:chemotaxis protein CheC
MELTALQQDALVELLNIGFGRAAASLSQLTGHRVLLDVPQVTLHAIDEVGDALERVVHGHVASVHQIFTGPVSGDALLILDESGAAILKELLTNEPALPLSIDASAREVITEVGNILLNACLGTFGNLLKVQVSFSVPHLSIENVTAILESLIVSQQGIRYALIVHAGFRLRDTQVTGYLMIVLSVASLDRLIRAVEDWEHSQHQS